MTKLNPYINTKKRLIVSLSKSNEKKEVKMDELKNVMSLKRGRPKNPIKKQTKT